MNVTITPTESMPSSCLELMDLLRSAAVMNALVAITEVLIDLKDAKLRQFFYQITAKDGRLWKQFLYPTDGEGSQTFDVPGQWKPSEVTKQRDVRDTVGYILSKYPKLTTLRVTW